MQTATMEMPVGRIHWAPDYGRIAGDDFSAIEYWRGVIDYQSEREAGDTTFVRSMIPPVAANDNQPVDKPRIIGLIGFGGAGKSETARILRERYRFVAIHIGRPMKNMLRSLLCDLGYDETTVERYVDGDLKRDVVPELHRTSTEVQQFLGTEFGREFCFPDLWLNEWLRQVGIHLDRGERVVQESVRFTNEADAIRARGGIIVEVRRPGVGAVNGHRSEVFPTDPDVVLRNDGSIRDLQDRVSEIVM